MDKELIKQAQQAYDEGHPIMSDEAFDNLTNDESQFKLTEDTYTIKHQHIMGTLPKSHSAEEVNKFLKEGTYYVQPKFDGISCEIVLDNGKVQSISTRGQGDYGKDLTSLLKAGFIKNVDFNPSLLSVYGELTRYNGNPSQKDRNIVAGICNSSNPSQDDAAHLRLNVYKAYTNEVVPLMPYELEQIYISNSPQIKHAKCFEITVPITEETSKEMFTKFDDMYKTTKRDGVVFRDTNGTDLLALKPEPKSAITKIEDVSWTKGKDKFAATAIITPVNIGDVTISKVTLPDKYITEMDLHIGDYIEVIRAGDVIPKIVRKVKDGEDQKTIAPVMQCEYGHELIKVGKALVCSDDNCKSFEDNYVHKMVDIMFWNVKRAPKSKMHKLIDSDVVTLQNVLDIDSYENKLTDHEYSKVQEGLTTLQDNTNAKLLTAFDVSGLTFKFAQKLFTNSGVKVEDIIDDQDPKLAPVKYILENSKAVKEFIENTEK